MAGNLVPRWYFKRKQTGNVLRTDSKHGNYIMAIHSTAVVSPKAEIGGNVDIGPFAVVEEHVIIGDNCFIDAHAKIAKFTTLGARCKVHFGAVVGDTPQDHSFDPDTVSHTEIGADTVIKEYVTIHRSPKEGFKTIIGNHCMLMCFSHVAHDVIMGDRVTIVNHTALSGHVQVGSGAVISGYNLFHQFCRIGTLAMVGPGNHINMDIPPYTMLGEPGFIYGPNAIGMRRAGFPPDVRMAVRQAIKCYFFSDLSKAEALEKIEEDGMLPEVEHFVEFIKSSNRGIMPVNPKHHDVNQNIV